VSILAKASKNTELLKIQSKSLYRNTRHCNIKATLALTHFNKANTIFSISSLNFISYNISFYLSSLFLSLNINFPITRKYTKNTARKAFYLSAVDLKYSA
jgi:hypothetical protein